MSIKRFVALSFFILLTAYAQGQVPGIINYQGRVVVNGTNFTGSGQFKFALVDTIGATTFWSNGVNVVTNTVTKGLYSVLLGDTSIANMATIPATVFTNSDVRLRVWFNDGVSGLQQLSPDQRLAAVGYALIAANIDPTADVTGRRLNIGVGHTLSGTYATIAGGDNNTAGNSYDTVGGGRDNAASGQYSTVAGGRDNKASVWKSTVGGGSNNSATNNYACVPGGVNNVAGGNYSFAAGRNAKAIHNGAFVWADSTDADFASTASNQFLIRAAGGVGIGKANPATALDVNGTVTATAFQGNGSGLTNLNWASLATPPPGMVLIPAGSFTMGNSIGDADITNAATVTANVSAFYMDVNLVSWSQWQSVYFWATNNGFGFAHAGAGKAANHPVQMLDWYDCVKWCNARSEQAGKTPVYYTDAGFTTVYRTGEVTVYANWSAIGYRLPTEAEWEKAARGGLSGQRFPWGNVINQNLANYYGNTTGFGYDLGPNGYNVAFTNGVSPYTSPVGSFAANVYGLYDMAGNVFEWCWDWYGIPYGQPTTTNPTGPGTGSDRVFRGGGWGNYACRSASRLKTNPTTSDYSIGFRAVLAPQ